MIGEARKTTELKAAKHTNPDRVYIHTNADISLRSKLAPQGTAIVVTQEITLGQLLAFSLIAMRFSAPVVQASRM